MSSSELGNGSVAIITAVATIVAGGLGVIAATFSQDRARMQRERTLASALLADIARIRSALLPIDPPSEFDPLALPPPTRLHEWVQPAVIELAGLDPTLFGLLVEVEPRLQLREQCRVSYHSLVVAVDRSGSDARDLEGAIESPDELWHGYGFATLQASRDRLGDLLEEERRYTVDRDAREQNAKYAAGRVEHMLEQIELRLMRIVHRRIPRIPSRLWVRLSGPATPAIADSSPGAARVVQAETGQPND